MQIAPIIENLVVTLWGKLTTKSPLQRTALALVILLVLIVGVSTVYRASRSHGSQYDDFYNFSKDLLYKRINIYDAYAFERTTIAKYPPFFGVLFAPLVPIPFLIGATIWFLTGVTLLYLASRAISGMGWALFKGKGTAPPMAWRVVPLIMTTVVIMSNLATSQINIFIFSLIVIALDHFIKRRDHWAGLLIGIAAAIKLTPGLFVLYFAYKGCWKTVLWAAIGGLICWAIVLPIIMGPEYYMEVMSSWLGMLQSYAAEGTSVDGLAGYKHTNQSLEAAFYRYLTHTPANGGFDNFYVNLVNITHETADMLVKIIKLMLLGILAFLCRTPIASRSDFRLMFEFSLIIIATLYISPISWINHYIVMILPFATTFYYLTTTDKSETSRRRLLIALIVAVLLTYLTHPIFLAFSLAFFGSLYLFVTMARGLASGDLLNRSTF